MAAVELVNHRDTREAFSKEANLAKKLGDVMAKRGLLSMRLGDNIILAPPAVHHEGRSGPCR